MDEVDIEPVSALDGVVTPGRYGQRAGNPGVTATEIKGSGLALVTAREVRQAALADAVQAAFGIELPGTSRCVAGREIALIWSGPAQWLAYGVRVPEQGMEALLAGPLSGLASIVDQSHGRTLLRMTGPRVRDALAKGLTIDLHPRAFKSGDVAASAVAHIGVHLWQTDDQPTYEIAVPRGFALSFWHWLEASAAEYGLEFVVTR